MSEDQSSLGTGCDLLVVLFNRSCMTALSRYLASGRPAQLYCCTRRETRRTSAIDIGHYRPICLLSVFCKPFTRVILNRIERTLE
ncbi:hypothetical protein Y032_0037g3396 [Ancylostoma ceylanicum]|uniref:Uncharacterized protein n=1 Tax=Ancylostoma ceylanicum TaxID=53326 RepID=A0A016UJY3_9BILA|nr:hypothetical protein Y032_0037g3396 [Ancylostoma ceylanicum]